MTTNWRFPGRLTSAEGNSSAVARLKMLVNIHRRHSAHSHRIAWPTISMYQSVFKIVSGVGVSKYNSSASSKIKCTLDGVTNGS